jgi:hypothetical protein
MKREYAVNCRMATFLRSDTKTRSGGLRCEPGFNKTIEIYTNPDMRHRVHAGCVCTGTGGYQLW